MVFIPIGLVLDSMVRGAVKDKPFGCFASLTPPLRPMLYGNQADGGGMPPTSGIGIKGFGA